MRVVPRSKGLPRWPRVRFPGELEDATARLREHLLGRVDDEGALREPCRGRVLETALMLALCDRMRVRPAAYTRLRGFLTAHRDRDQPLEVLLARAALGEHPCTDRLDITRILLQAPEFTGHRKLAFLQAVFVLLDCAPRARTMPAEAFSLVGLHTWARVQVTAVKAVLASAGYTNQPIEAAELRLLRFTQGTGTVWEGNLLIHLFVLHALAGMPGHDELVVEGIQTAMEHQRADGGMPFIRDEDTWVTATGGVALHAAGAPREVSRAIAGRLVGLQRPDGGWSYTEDAQLTDVDCTSVALEMLHLAGPGYGGPIERGIHALGARRGADGGFPTYLAQAPSEACMTAAAVNALSIQGGRQETIVRAALDYLAARQRPDGSFPPDWSSSRHHTVFRAVLAASRASGLADGVQRMLRRAQGLVLSSQNSDGGWGQQQGAPSDALSTAYALISLNGHGDPSPAARGIGYLLTQQRADGSIASITDSVGPRPFGFAVPVLADVFTLLSLGHLLRRLDVVGTTARVPWPRSRLRGA